MNTFFFDPGKVNQKPIHSKKPAKWMALWGVQLLSQACYHPTPRQEAAETDTDGKSSNSGGVTAGPNSGTSGSTTQTSSSMTGSSGPTETSDSTTGTSSPISDTLSPPTTGTTNGVMELCYNGIDDDGDNLIDCEDEEDCIDSICVPEPPPGWSELGVFQDVEAGSLSDCVEPYGNLVLEGGHQPNAKDAECTPCECGNAKPTGCSGGRVSTYENEACASGVDPVKNEGLGCKKGVFNNTQTQSLKFLGCLGSPGFTDGTCTKVKDGITKIDPWVWTKEDRFCGFSQQVGGGCSQGNICVPKPGAEFVNDGVCISHTDDVACPENYSQRHVFYQDLQDNRGCSSCDCGNAYTADAYLYYNVKGYEGTQCQGNPIITVNNITSNSMCTSSTAQSFVFENYHSGSSCKLGGADKPTGSVTPKDPITVCCNSPE